jgi:hypothetical protein
VALAGQPHCQNCQFLSRSDTTSITHKNGDTQWVERALKRKETAPLLRSVL